MRSMRKIEDRPRPEKRRAIPRANRERSTDHQIPNSPLHELHECVALSGRVAKTQDKGMEDRSRQRIVVPPKEAAPQRIEEEVIDRLFPYFSFPSIRYVYRITIAFDRQVCRVTLDGKRNSS